MLHRLLVGCFLLLLSASSSAEVYDGKIYDPGATLEAPADMAPEALAQMAGFVGEWDLQLEVHRPGQDVLRSKGVAKVTYANRGHSLMERTRIANFDGQGHPMATFGFLSVNTNGVWTVAEGNSWTESISVASGDYVDGRLVLHNSLRPGGGPVHLLFRYVYAAVGEDDFSMTMEMSKDLGSEWTLLVSRSYHRRTAEPDFFRVRNDIGLPAVYRPDEAGQFDFLLGEFDANHWLKRPQQGVTQWSGQATAVYALDGIALLEFNWNDNDPTFPTAATSILRIYNRSMRRWESLFLSNRSNSPLHFGGVQEGQRIVLHPFAAQTGSNPLSQWIFFDDRSDAYRWKGLRSGDRGGSWQLYWGIDFVRKGVDITNENDQIPPTEVTTTTADGVQIFGDHFRPTGPAAMTVLLFHQARGDARGEHGDIARRLQKEGFEVFAWDTRSGGDRFGQNNRTTSALDGSPSAGYCSAYPDLEAALEYSVSMGSGGSVYALGSSFSAALVIRLGAEHGDLLAGIASFSPASGRMGECAVENWLPKLEETPLLAFRPASEMEVESVIPQTQLFAERDVGLVVASDASHGASMLHPGRSKNVETTWMRLLAFFSDPDSP